MLVALKFDRQGCDVVVDLAVVHDFAGQAPVISVSHCSLEYLKVASRACEHVPEPDQQGFNGGVSTGVSLSIEVDGVGLLVTVETMSPRLRATI
jgi:3-deoxy-D-arabino-heptulosonate 7-phosphate (DAHP) synthase class II